MLRSDGVLAVERWWVGLDGEDAVATQVCAKSYMCFFKIVKNKGLDRINLPLHPAADPLPKRDGDEFAIIRHEWWDGTAAPNVNVKEEKVKRSDG